MIRNMLLSAVVLLLAASTSAQGVLRSELTVGYGFAPVSNWIDAYGDLLAGSFKGRDTSLSDWGAVSVGYNLRLIGNFSVGVQGVYSSNKRSASGSDVTVRNRYWSVVPNVKWGWLGLKIVSFYSRLGVGATFSRARAGDERKSSTQLAFQVAPLGVEVGGRVAAYAEAGIGTAGCFVAGVRCRF